jgi:hypothetical protein
VVAATVTGTYTAAVVCFASDYEVEAVVDAAVAAMGIIGVDAAVAVGARPLVDISLALSPNT